MRETLNCKEPASSIAAKALMRLHRLPLRPNPAVNADVPGTFDLQASRGFGTPVTLYR